MGIFVLQCFAVTMIYSPVLMCSDCSDHHQDDNNDTDCIILESNIGIPLHQPRHHGHITSCHNYQFIFYYEIDFTPSQMSASCLEVVKQKEC